jgi:two-component sensor histidine kinase
VEVTYSPCYDGSGEIIGIVVNTRDSTEREEAQEHIRRSLAEKEVLLKEVHHRVKNNLQIVCSLLDLSARRVDTEEGWELAREMETKIMAMALIHSSLYERERFDAIDMDTFIRDLFGHLRRMFDGDGVRPSFCGGTLHLPLDKAIPCALFLNEALTNVFKHAAGDGGCRVTMGCSIRDGRVNILLSDDGPGFPEGFDQPGSQGLGVKLMRNLAEMQLRGEVAFEGNHGAEVRLSFPLENAGL